MEFHEYDVVALTIAIQAIHKATGQPILLQPGQVGTILMQLGEEAYLVDFSDPQGVTYAMESIPPTQLMQLHYEPAPIAA